MDELLGYWVDLFQIKLSDEPGTSRWIQALPVGTWEHPIHGELEITQEKIQRFSDNFHQKVREQDLDIDYDHKAHNGKASGWIRNAQARADGLWILVEWTKDAFDSIKNKEYRYFSPEFMREWKNPRTGQKYSDVLFGGALTNRPFLKGILPINLSEVLTANDGGNLMDSKKLRELLGLKDDSTDAEVDTALATKLSVVEEDKTKLDPKQDEEKPKPEVKPDLIAASETTVIKLDDGTTITATELLTRMATLEAATKLSEVDLQLVKLDDGNTVIAPAVKEELRVILSDPKITKAQQDGILAVVKKLTTDGVIQLGELGGTGEQDFSNDPTKQFQDLVSTAIKASEGMGYAEAVEAVAGQNPDLWNKYRAATYLTQGV